MARLIDANALAEEIYQRHHYVHGVRNGKTLLIEYAEEFREDVLRAICKAPTVYAKPVVHGRWLRHWNNYICDACHDYAWLKYNYCPNCGADMRESKED